MCDVDLEVFSTIFLFISGQQININQFDRQVLDKFSVTRFEKTTFFWLQRIIIFKISTFFWLETERETDSFQTP